MTAESFFEPGKYSRSSSAVAFRLALWPQRAREALERRACKLRRMGRR